MSNLFKSGFQGLKTVGNEPYIFDGNKRKFDNAFSVNIGGDTVAQTKIIRPLTEQQANDESEELAQQIIGQGALNDAMDMAKELREDAIERAKKIVEDAEKEAEDIKNNAYNLGYEKGLEEGSMEAMRRSDEYLESLQREREQVEAKNQELFEANVEDTQGKLVDLSCALIEKLTGIVVDQYKQVMIYIINNALNDNDTARNFTIRVAESNYTYIMDNYERISKATNPNFNIEVVGDVKLDKRQCIIDTENGIMDLSMDIQVQNLITAMKLLS